MDNNQISQEEIEASKELLKYNKAITSSVTEYIKLKEKVLKRQREIEKTEMRIAVLQRESNDENKEELENKLELLKALKSQNRIETNALSSITTQKMLIAKIDKGIAVAYAGYIGLMTKYLIDAQKSYKNLNRELGLSNVRSAVLLNNIENVASYAHSLGASYEDVAKIQSSFSNELGRSVLLSSSNLKNILEISKGLNLSVEEAGKLVGVMNNYGLSIDRAHAFYENTLKSSRKIGLNASSVVKTINANLEKSQGYVFKGGVEGLSKMAQHAVKFKMNMESVFNSIDKSNSIEGAVDMISNLQVLGGKFASLDFHTTLFQARNDTEAFAKSMSTLTKGIATFNNKTGEFTIQAGDLQRLRLASEATGITYEDLIKNAKEVAKIGRIDELLLGKGLSKEQKDLVSSIANIDSKGKFTIDVGDGIMRDIRSLTQSQLNSLQKSQDGLKESAKNALAFDETWKSLINEVKSLTLPMLKVMNSAVKIMQNEFVGGALKFAIGAGAIIYTAKGITSALTKVFTLLNTTSRSGSLLGSFIDSVKGLLGKGGINRPSTNTMSPTPLNNGQQGSQFINSLSKVDYKNILALGGAMLMVGGAINIASVGLSKFVSTYKELSSSQAKEANKGLAIFGGTLTLLGAGIIAIGYAGQGASLGMLAFGGAVALVGAGIGLASYGVSILVDSLTDFSKVANKTFADNLFLISGGIASIGLASMTLGNIPSLIGMSLLKNNIEDISLALSNSNFSSLMDAGNGMVNLSNAINSINNEKIDKLLLLTKNISDSSGLIKAISDLDKIFNKPLKVEFDNTKVNLNLDITNEISGQLINKLSKMIPLTISNSKKGI